jgi:hypothetical protein
MTADRRKRRDRPLVPGGPTAAELADQAGATPQKIAQVKRKIAADLGALDAMHVLALLADVSTHVLPTSFPLPLPQSAVVEYLATVLLERSDPHGLRDDDDSSGSHATRQAAEQALVAAEDIVGATLTARMLASGAAETPLEQLSADLAYRDVLFRWPSYSDQERAALESLFETPQVSAALRDVLGFDAQIALRLYDATVELIQRRREALSEHFAHVITAIADREPQVAAASPRLRRHLQLARAALDSALQALEPRELDACRTPSWRGCASASRNCTRRWSPTSAR